MRGYKSKAHGNAYDGYGFDDGDGDDDGYDDGVNVDGIVNI